MTSFNLILFALIVLLLVGFGFIVFWFLNKSMNALSHNLSDSLFKTQELVQQQLQNVQQNLSGATGQIHTRLEESARTFQQVSNQLVGLSETTKLVLQAAKNISSLEEILKPPKLRGGMGEILLENILREVLPSKDFYRLQYAFSTGETVDAIIQLKEGIIPVDAKFPLENFRRMISTENSDEQIQWRKSFVRDIKKHIDDIAHKYIRPDEGTFPFALMYIPAENVYYETIVRGDDKSILDTDLYSYSTQKHVFPVSPNSFYPYLMTLALGLRGLKIEEKANFILSELTRLSLELEKFTKDFRVIGSHLSDAQKKYLEAEKKLDRVEIKLTSLKEGQPELDLI